MPVAGRAIHVTTALFSACVLLHLTTASNNSTSPPWFVSVHYGDVEGNLTRAAHAFRAAAAAGFRGVRADVRWGALEPERGAWSSSVEQGLVAYFALAAKHGLAALPIVGSPPSWAKQLFSSNSTRPAFYSAYANYTRRIANALVAGLDSPPTRWQLFNELNTPAGLGWTADECGILGVPGRVLREVEGSVRGVSHGAALQEQQQWQLMVNPNTDVPLFDWRDAVERWLAPACAGDVIDVIGIDHYPGTYNIEKYSDWGPLDQLLSMVGNTSSTWFGKAPAILETGFSSWSSVVASEEDQVKWINVSLPMVREKVAAYSAASVGRPFALGNFYELLDGNAGLNPVEACFGILRKWDYNGSESYLPKPSYAALASELHQFSRALCD